MVSKALSRTLTPAKVDAPLAKHFHNTAPDTVVLVAVLAGKPDTVVPDCV